MDRKNVSSGSPMEGPIGFSRASRIGNVIAVAGTAAIGLNGQTVGVNNVYEQTKHCIDIERNDKFLDKSFPRCSFLLNKPEHV